MRRTGSSFLTMWVLFLIPSTIVWGLMLRAGERSAAWFESTWHQVINLLTFPLLAKPLTDWAWQALESGATLSASLGFGVLVSVWAMTLALPLVLVGSWWVWLANRATPQPRSVPTPVPTSTTLALPAPAPVAAPSPLGALYIITIPFALVWLLIRSLTRFLTALVPPVLRFVWPILLVSALVFGAVVAWYSFVFSKIDYVEWQMELSNHFINGVWYGYLDSLRIPRIFEEQWMDAMYQTQMNSHYFDGRGREGWVEHMDGWYRHPELRNLIAFTAMRHALGIAIVVTGLQALRRLISRGGT